MTYRDRVLEKLNSLPEPQRGIALREFEVHEYCAANEKKHICMIEDIPHPLLKPGKVGGWDMG